MNDRRESDRPVVPGKSPNKVRGAPRTAEGMEGRGLAKGNSAKQSRTRAQNRRVLTQALDRVRQVVFRDEIHVPRKACAFDLRQEPSAVVPLAGICAGGGPKGPFLPRPHRARSALVPPSAAEGVPKQKQRQRR